MSLSMPLSTPASLATVAAARAFLLSRRAAVGDLIEGRHRELDLLAICFATLGHPLIVGPTGTGKTRTARAWAHVLGVSYGRIQGRSDLLPSGIVGYHRYSDAQHQEVFVPGPVFHGLVLADEINRSPEEAKGSLLEPMEEGQATVDGIPYAVPAPGLVIGTLNPRDGGTYPLLHPERERFRLHVPFAYLPAREAVNWLTQFDRYDSMPEVSAGLAGAESEANKQHAALLGELRRAVVHGITMAPDIVGYIVALVQQTRLHDTVEEGCGDRAISHLFLASKAVALFAGHDSVWPDDVQQIAPYVLAHRMTTANDQGDFAEGRAVVQWALEQVPVPQSPVAVGRR